MQGEIPKSDWKHFKKLHELALERLCEQTLNAVCKISKDSTRTHHERYQAVFGTIQENDKKIESGFDMLSRSRMIDHLAVMKSLDLIEETEIAKFTQETRDRLDLYLSIDA